MSYQPDDPRSAPRVARDNDGMIDTVAKVGVFFACTFIVVLVLYAMNRDDQIAATTSVPAPATTTGQSTSAEPKAEPKAESKGDTKTESKGDTKTESKGDTKTEPKADPKSEPKAK